MNILERIKAPTPKFFQTLRAIGLVMLGISGSILTAPVALPALFVSIAGYAAVAGGVLSAVSQVTVMGQGHELEDRNTDQDGG